MASFSAELRVAGQAYPLRLCSYEFTQATSQRGQVAAKVRMGLVHLTLDVPTNDQLLSWAATPFKPLAGQVAFFAAQGGSVLETLSWEAGQCVGYQEGFAAGDTTTGAYICQLTIAAPQLTVQPGSATAYINPAAGEHGSPELALLGVPPVLTPPATPLVLPTVEELAAAVGEKALEGLAAVGTAVALPIALTLALILGSTTPAQAPSIPQLHPLPIDPKLLRFNTLLAKHSAGTLTPDEEAELLDLLAKVKGIHANRLQDIADSTALTLPMRGGRVPLRNFTILLNFAYTKRTAAARQLLRRAFENGERKAFLQDMANDPVKVTRLKQLGMSDENRTALQPVWCRRATGSIISYRWTTGVIIALTTWSS
ncbi:MAG: type VI secretion system tube protein TssD [Janthinobacterium lividum]